MKTTDFRPYYEAYDDRYRQVHQAGHQWMGDFPTPILSELLGEAKTVLELGCGEGRDAIVLLEQGYDLLATDISPEAIRFCQAKFPQYAEHFKVLDFLHGRLEERFDFIYAVAVLHMLILDEDRDGFYRFLREHLTEGGRALVCVMGDGETEWKTNPDKAFTLQERTLGGQPIQVAGTTYRRVNFETMQAEIHRNGFMITRQGLAQVPDYDTMMYALIRRSK